MKPFNLEEAKAGKPVCTRDGKPARIICFDLNSDDFTIVALVQNDNGLAAYESVESFTAEGRFYAEQDYGDTMSDLFMAPVTKTVWVNLYLDSDGSVFVNARPCDTEAEASQWADAASNYIGAFPLTYEE